MPAVPSTEFGTCLACLRDHLVICTSVHVCAQCTRLAVDSFTQAAADSHETTLAAETARHGQELAMLRTEVYALRRYIAASEDRARDRVAS